MNKSSVLIAALLFNTSLISVSLFGEEVKIVNASIVSLTNLSGNDLVSIPPIQGNGGINPAHGLPGHRCDIAVGASLNSAPSKTTAPVQNQRPGETFPLMLANPSKPNTNTLVNSTPVQTSSVSKLSPAPPKTTNSTASGLNPAHGQPNHRCDIPVGSPLNSKPTTKATLPAQAAVPATTTPAKTISTNSAGLKLNPAHGEPGHDCSIKVGEPLKQ